MTFTVCTDMSKLFITLVSDHGHCHDSYRLRTELDLFADRSSTDMDSTDKKFSSDGGSIGKIIAVVSIFQPLHVFLSNLFKKEINFQEHSNQHQHFQVLMKFLNLIEQV